MPSRSGGYWYYTRTVEGQQYGIHCRTAVVDGGDRPAGHRGRPAAGRARRSCSTATRWPATRSSSRSAPSTSSPDSAPARLLRRPHRRRAVHPADQGPAHRRPARRRGARTCSTARPGRPTASTLFYPTVDEAWRPVPGLAARARHARGRRRPGLRGARRAVLGRRRADPLGAVHRRSTFTARSPARSGCIPAGDPPARRPWSRRAGQGVEYGVEHDPPATGS